MPVRDASRDDHGVHIHDVRRDLRGLLGLELAHLVVAICLFVAIGVAGLSSRGGHLMTAITTASLLALTSLTLALRVHVGRAPLRDDLRALELEWTLRAPRRATGAHPYRTPAAPHCSPPRTVRP